MTYEMEVVAEFVSRLVLIAAISIVVLVVGSNAITAYTAAHVAHAPTQYDNVKFCQQMVAQSPNANYSYKDCLNELGNIKPAVTGSKT